MNEKNGGMAQRGMVAERGILGINGEITIRQPQVGTGKTMLINYLLEVRTGRIFRDRTAA
jgi:hypothetical protein